MKQESFLFLLFDTRQYLEIRHKKREYLNEKISLFFFRIQMIIILNNKVKFDMVHKTQN